jgi:hypothetical protein
MTARPDPAPGPRRPRSRALGRAVARLERRMRGEAIALGEAADALDRLGPLYLLMAVACVAVSPLSGIPLMTTACGLSIAALSAQLLLGRRRVWLPGGLRRRLIATARLRSGLGGADRMAGALEFVLRRRLPRLTRGPLRASLLGACLCIGLAMPFMEVVPFGGTTLASVVLVIALALVARDGLAALAAAGLLGAGVAALGVVLI